MCNPKLNKNGNGKSYTIYKNLQKSPRSNSEALAIQFIEEITGERFPTAFPSWLKWNGKNLELDGYCKKLRIGLEFSGPLHTKWYSSTEPYQKYYERVIRDIVKQKLCAKNGVTLIVIDMSLPSHHWKNYIKSRLFDAGAINDKPMVYIDIQYPEPFRNPQIEEELGLSNKMDSVMAL